MKKEGFRLGWFGIVIGTLLGILMPVLFVPDAFNFAKIAAAGIMTMFICWIMIAVSILIPIKSAANISPIEAVHFSAKQVDFKKRNTASQKLNAFTLGMKNFIRDKRKAAGILMSLSIGGILLLVVSTLLLTYSPEALSRKYFPNGDYKIYIKSDREIEDILYAGNPLTEELKQKVSAIDGVKDIDTVRQSAGADFKASDVSAGGMSDRITADNYADIKSALIDGMMPSDSHSILVSSAYHDIPQEQPGKLRWAETKQRLPFPGFFLRQNAARGRGMVIWD